MLDFIREQMREEKKGWQARLQLKQGTLLLAMLLMPFNPPLLIRSLCLTLASHALFILYGTSTPVRATVVH